METISITLQNNQTLADALLQQGYKNIPSNVILDKTLTGIGATHIEITSRRHSIIIEPNVPVIKGKTTKHPHTLGVYKGAASKKIQKYMSDDSIPYKKIITTPESFHKIKKAAAELNINIHSEYFCLFDECEKIAQDIDYRENITYPINDFFQFKNKAFVSATPSIIKHPDIKNFKKLKIVPQFDYKVPVTIYATDKIKTTIQKHITALAQNSTLICVFYNSVSGISEIISLLNLTDKDYAVFCSENGRNSLSVKNINAQEDFNPLLLKKYNFFTSRFFSAVDMEINQCPDIVMITDLNHAKHSMIDPFTEAVQIQGRFRTVHPCGKRYNSICHISNFINFKPLTDEQVLEQFNVWKKQCIDLKKDYGDAENNNQKKAVEKSFWQNPLYKYLINQNIEQPFEVNYFSVINKYMEERLKTYYSSRNNLMDAYQQTDFYIPTLNEDDINPLFSFNITGDLVTDFTNPRIAAKERIQLIIKQLDNGTPAHDILNLVKSPNSADIHRFTQDVINGYKLFGADAIKDKTINSIRKMYEAHQNQKATENLITSKDFCKAVADKFADKMDTYFPKNECKQMLSEVFRRFHVKSKNDKDYRVTNDTIKNYFKVTEDNRAGVNAVCLKSILPAIQSIIED